MSQLRGLESYVVICDEIEDHMNWHIQYEHGHPAGYTDDLGIIADRDQWVDEVLPGWYARPADNIWSNISELCDWCGENFKGHWTITNTIYMTNPDDVTLFKMRWL